MPKIFQVGDFVECIDGCCEPNVIGKIIQIEVVRYEGHAHNRYWVRFSKALSARHDELWVKPDINDTREGGNLWPFHFFDLRHTTKRRMSQ
jgi:hypothetical protein